MSFFTRSIRGSLAVFGVAVGLICTAGAASAQEAPPASDDSASVTPAEETGTVGTASAPSEEAEVGEALLIERPAPRPAPANELRSDAVVPAAPAAVLAPARAPIEAPSGGVVAPAVATAAVAAPAPAVVAPVRPTAVKGVQIQRSEVGQVETASLARTGSRNHGLVVVAGLLLVLGSVLVFAVRPHPAR